MTLQRTPSQTVGPYFAIGMCRRADNLLDEQGVDLVGRVLDGAGDPVPDALIEVWDAIAGVWGRCGTTPEGSFSFRIPTETGALETYVFARGLLRHERTRIVPAELARDGDGRLRFDIRLQGDEATTFYET